MCPSCTVKRQFIMSYVTSTPSKLTCRIVLCDVFIITVIRVKQKDDEDLSWVVLEVTLRESFLKCKFFNVQLNIHQCHSLIHVEQAKKSWLSEKMFSFPLSNFNLQSERKKNFPLFFCVHPPFYIMLHHSYCYFLYNFLCPKR